ncbi:MAG: TolC family protein [Armatimonadetes bacterium]|nr:TolC family protein [Armatimonadota bacterium]
MRKRIVTSLLAGLIAISAMAAMAERQPIVLDLKSASQLALKTSPQIGSAGASADMSKAEVGKAKSALYPNVGAESGYSYLTKPTFFGGTPVLETNTVINRIAAQQMIYSGGQIQSNLKRARQSYLAVNHGARATQANVLANVGTAYFRARQAKETIDVANASVKSLEASYDAAKKLHDSGVVTNSDVLRAQVALTSAKSDSITATNDYNVAMAALRSAIGLPRNACIDLAGDANDTAPDAALLAAPVERPEIAAGSASVQAAEAGKKAARAGKLPTVALVADYFNEPVGAQFPRLTNTVMAGVLVKFNVFDGGLTRASINEADAASRKARQDLETEKRRVELEQQAAKLDLDSACARVETTATQVQSAEESLRALQVGYKEGMTPLTDVLSAQTALTAAKVSRLAALYDVKIAQVNLLRAYGQTDVLAH